MTEGKLQPTPRSCRPKTWSAHSTSCWAGGNPKHSWHATIGCIALKSGRVLEQYPSIWMD